MSRSNGPVPMAGGPPLQWPESAETAALTGRPAAAPPQARRPVMQPPPQVHAAQTQMQAAMAGQHRGGQGYQAAPVAHQAPQQQAGQPHPQSHQQHAHAAAPTYHYPQGGLAQPAQSAAAPAAHRPAMPQARGAQGLVPPVMGIGQQDFGAPPRAAYAPQFESAFEPAPERPAAAYPNAQQAAAVDATQALHPALRQPRMAQPHPQSPQPAARGWPPQQHQQPQQPQQHGATPQPAVSQAVPNPANYDFGSYYPNANGFAQPANGYGTPHGANGQRPPEAVRSYPDTARGDPGLASLDWQSRMPYPQGGGPGDYQDPALDPAYADQDPNAYPPEEMYEGEVEEQPKKGINKWLLVGTLVATIVVGAGMVKGYSWWQGRSAAQAEQRGSRGPTVAAIKAPSRIKTTEAAVAKVPHQGVTILNGADTRPPEGSTPARGADDVGAPRKVQTLVFGKDGSVQGNAAPAAPPTAGVPGMIVELPRRPAPEAQPVPQAPPAAPPKAAAPIQPKVITIAPPAQPAAQVAPPQPPQGRVITVPPRQQVPKVAVAHPPPAAPGPVAAATGAGYVAAVVSKRSQMEALTALADLQQKHAGVLQGKTATIQEANLGEKGVWYRVIVGPPGSREAAANVCSQLKGQGFGGCWTFAY